MSREMWSKMAPWVVAGLGGSLALLGPACGDVDPDDPPTTDASGTAGAGPGGSGGAGGGTAGSSSSAGGAGGSDCGTGGQTDAPQLPCLDAGAYADLFKVQDPKLCVVAIYDSDLALDYATVPTWGRHGGPIVVRPGKVQAAEIVRLTPPPAPAASGAMTSTQTEIAAAYPASTFLGPQAVDLPFFDWTAISWSASFGSPGGEVLLVHGDKVEQTYKANAFYAAAGLGTCTAGRLVYSGLSVLDNEMPGTNALYAADSCGTQGKDARLLPYGDSSCASPIAVEAFGDASGPVAVDLAGNAIALMVTFDTAGNATTSAHGFESSAIARGAPPVAGAPLFSLSGSGTSLAAIAPTSTETGIVAFQGNDATTFEALDPIEQRYSVDLKPVGSPATLFKLKVPNTSTWMFSDSFGRLWVGVSSGTGTKYLVVTTTPP